MTITNQHDTTAGYETRQYIIGYFVGFEFTQYTVAVTGYVGNFSISLVVPEGKTSMLCQVLSLVNKTTSKAASRVNCACSDVRIVSAFSFTRV